jgi:hypothetical protein
MSLLVDVIRQGEFEEVGLKEGSLKMFGVGVEGFWVGFEGGLKVRKDSRDP